MALLQDIRSDATLRRVPVVMIAAAPDAETVRSAYEQGVNSLVCNSRRREDSRRAVRGAGAVLGMGQ